MTTVTLHPGDNRETLRRLIDQGVRVHSVVTDPPYGLVSVQKRFGKEGAAPARSDNNDGSFARLSGGFMGKAWDGTGIERDPEFWKLIYDVLLPGGYVFAFSGSRTGHWQACAMEMAGFIMHPMHGWAFGSGFPKAHAADKAIDKMLGTSDLREVTGPSTRHAGQSYQWAGENRHPTHSEDKAVKTSPGSLEAAQWEGWAYGTQAQKPALEPIYLGQKPFSEKTGAANLLKHGVGAINIDGCRVGYMNADDQASAKPQGRATAKVGALAGKTQHDGERSEFEADNTKGRHPANLILDGSPEVVAMFPHGKSGNISPDHKRNTAGGNGVTHGEMAGVLGRSFGDSGSAARFFHQFPRYACEECQDRGWVVNNQSYGNPYGEQESCECGGPLTPANPLFYHPKAGKQDRAGSKHPTVKPIALMQYLIRHITPPGGIVLDPFAGSGTTGEAARREGFDCILMEAEPEYIEFLEQRFSITSDDRTTTPSLLHNYLQLLGITES